jgi:hypothetical protein
MIDGPPREFKLTGRTAPADGPSVAGQLNQNRAPTEKSNQNPVVSR